MKSASVKINEHTVEWDERLGAFFVQPSPQLMLRLYAKRFLRRDILIASGTHEIRLPVEPTGGSSFMENPLAELKNSHIDQSINLISEGNKRQYGETTRPVTLHLTITVSANSEPSPGPPMPPTVPGTPETEDARQSGPPTPIATENETTIDDIVKEVKRFRILSIGRSGVGKSTLINTIFGIDAAHVEDYKPGKADIQQEFVSAENPFFVLHDSKGFEPGDLVNFETVCEFIQQRSRRDLPLSERIHGLWLCTETPTAGGRVFERGDEELLLFAHKNQLPIVVVFTQYDRLVRTKEDELREDHPHMDPTHRRNQSVVEAQKAFDVCLRLLELSMNRLGIPMPCHARVSVRPGHQEDVSSLAKVTQDIVKERVNGDAWAFGFIEFIHVYLPLESKGTSYYRRALMGSVPGLGPLSLRNCLEKVHKNIVTCWNFKGEVLNSPKFQEQMLELVHDVYTELNVSICAHTTSVTTPAPILPPISIGSPVEIFVQWLSTAVLENVPSVQRVLIAYSVDLVSVLVELFGITLGPKLAFRIDWPELQAAFEAYERSFSRQRIRACIRESICSNTREDNEGILIVDGINKKLHKLLQEQIEMPPSK
ncbi:hypothetical protein EDB87DRAFT_1682171 [Lactarius vividus]|nr:hypothetical protein EDB87DRAFT_1682171 [Lactarius vividus]